jgi:hypothetical protein
MISSIMLTIYSIAFYEIDAVPRTVLGKPKRSTMASCTTRPLTARSRLLSRDSIEALVLTETARACAIGAGTERSDATWLDRHSDQPFTVLGLTSLAGIVLRDSLASLTGLDLPTTLVFDHPTPEVLSEYLYRRLFVPEVPPVLPSSMPELPAVDDGVEPIAIVSMACRYPGGISSPEDLWRIVSDGVDVTSEFPDDVSSISYFFAFPNREASYDERHLWPYEFGPIELSTDNHRSAVGTSRPCTTQTQTTPAPQRHGAELSYRIWLTLTPDSSACLHARLLLRILNRGCC